MAGIGWNRLKITDWVAMAGAVSALVSRAGGESRLERDAGFTC